MTKRIDGKARADRLVADVVGDERGSLDLERIENAPACVFLS
jgi:hypothetical protein